MTDFFADIMYTKAYYTINEQVLKEMLSSSTYKTVWYISSVLTVYLVALVILVLHETYKVRRETIIIYSQNRD